MMLDKRSLRFGPILLLVLLSIGLVITPLGCAPRPLAPTPPAPPAPAVAHLNVTPAAFLKRWNAAVGEYRRGYTLDKVEITDRDLYRQGLNWCTWRVADWMVLEVLIHKDGYVGEGSIDAETTTAKQRDDATGVICAAIAAVTGLSPKEAIALFENQLGFKGTLGDFHIEIYETDHLAIRASVGTIRGLTTRQTWFLEWWPQ